MSYTRVLPRDLFNEANLPKVYGRLWILTENNPTAGFREESAPWFDIVQNEASGGLTVSNLTFQVRGATCGLERPMNSREAFPLYLTIEDDPDFEIAVFDDHGDFTPEMQTLIAPLQDAPDRDNNRVPEQETVAT